MPNAIADTPEIGSLDIAGLLARYRDDALSPVAVARAVLARIAAAGDDKVWISRVADADLLARAQALAALPTAERAALPLYGVPFAVKDNIDAAGLPTTAGCPAYAYDPDRSATGVQRLQDAGAMLIGKTNLDQFATGLVGVRSPYGVARNPFDPAYIPGGSSSGSAVAVSSGLVSFALGTDTAGSGRVPAGFTNIVGLKPTKGLISTAGVVPACRSLDCVSIFALTVEDSLDVLAVMAAPDPADPYSRKAPPTPAAPRAPFRFGTPRPDQLRFFGNAEAERIHREALDRLEACGGQRVEIDFTPFAEAAALLYSGPWVAERAAAVGDFIAAHPDDTLPVTRKIIQGGTTPTAIDAFRATYRLEALRAQAAPVWERIDLMALPTSGTIHTIAELEADPIGANSNLGLYTNFVNLMDLCGIAVPAGFQANGLPAGITLLAPAFAEEAVGTVAAALHRAAALPLGASGAPLPPARPKASRPNPYTTGGLLELFVVGGHLQGMALNRQLTDLGARLVETASTAPLYRFHALPGEPARPGLVRVADGQTGGSVTGGSIAGEIWALTPDAFGRFVAAIPAPLGVGRVVLADGRRVSGFLCEAAAVIGAPDITAFGGWRAYCAHLAATTAD